MGGTPECTQGFRCLSFEVTNCSDLAGGAEGILAKGGPPRGVRPRGVVVFFGGSLGELWWGNTLIAQEMLSELRFTHDFMVVQVKWVDSWLKAGAGEQAGAAHVACRPETVLNWVHRKMYLPMGIDPPPGECGFCATGNSSGASPPAYALSHFGLEGILDASIPTSGPTHAAMEKGCLGVPGYEYNEQQANRVDYTFGFLADGTGPCALGDAGYAARWDEESVEIGGSDYSHPDTRIEFIIGENDDQVAPAHAADYRDVLLEDPLNTVTWTLVPGMGHTLQKSQAGLDALEAALLGAL
jgi:hypothetical protein